MSRSPDAPLRVLFVCAGNTCRSPMAEAWLRERAAQAGLAERISAASAGVSARPGDPINLAAARELAAHGIAASGSARRLAPDDFRHYDLLIALDRETHAAAEALRPAGQAGAPVRLLLAYAPELGLEDVFDPYGTQRYPEAFALIRQGVDGLFATLQGELAP